MTIQSTSNTNNNFQSVLKEVHEKRNKLGITNYLSSLSSRQLSNRTAYVATTTLGGAGIGAGVGSLAPAIGTTTGALVGGGVGLGIGLTTTMAWDLTKWIEWKSHQKEEVTKGMFEKLKAQCSRTLTECPITHEVPTTPVSIINSNVVYEREALEQWVRENGTDPMTRRRITLDDIRINHTAVGEVNRALLDLLNNRVNDVELTEQERAGVIVLQNHHSQNLRRLFTLETTELNSLFNNNRITQDEYMVRLNQFHESTRSRTNS